MARKYLTPIDLTGLELTNFKVQNLSSDPTAYGKGHTYYNTTHNELRTYNGTSWMPVGGSVMAGATNSRPAAGNAGRLYFDTTLNVLFYDNGTAWTQDGVSQTDLSSAISAAALTNTDGLSEGTTNLYFTTARARAALSATGLITYSSSSGEIGFDYTTLKSDLTTDGFLTTAEGYVTETGTESLSNKTFKGATYFQSGGGAGGTNNYVDVSSSTGGLTLHSGYPLDLFGQGQVTITSGGADIVLNADGNSYLGSVNTNNRIATIGDITSASITLYGTSDQITVDQNGSTFTLSLPSYINIDNGELHLKKTEYWKDGTQYGVIDANPYSNHFNIVATGRNLELESQSGNNILLNSGNFTQVTGNYFNSSASSNYFANSLYVGADAWNESNNTVNFGVYNNQGNAEFFVDTDSDVVNFIRRGNNNSIRVNLGQYANNVELNNYTNLVFNSGDATDQQGFIGIDGGFYVTATNNYELGLSSNSNRIFLETGNDSNIDFYTGNGTVRTHSSQEVYGDLTVGNHNNDSTFYVRKGDGTEVFRVATSADQVRFWGQVQGYAANDGNQFIHIYTDGGNEAILNAPNGDLILTADGAQYLNSNGTDANLIATRGYVDNAVAGLAWKQAANLLWDDSNATLTGATGTLSIDNHATLSPTNNGYRILIPYGTNAGIWVYEDDSANWTLSRSTDADTALELKGAAIFIEEGDIYGATAWVQSNHYLTDFTGQNWVQFSGSGTVTAGDGIAVSGQQVSVHKDDTLKFTAGALGVNYGDGIEAGGDGEIRAHLGTGLAFDGSGAVTLASGYGVRKYSATIGDGSATSYTVSHNFNTRDVEVSVYDTATYEEVIVDITRTNVNAVTIGFAAAPSANSYRVVVVG